MNKYEFLALLRSQLRSLPEEDARRSLDYYGEMIDDRMEDGMTEAEAVASLGDMDEIVKNILTDIPAVPMVTQKTKNPRRLQWWEILLLVLGFPVWGSLAIAAASVVFSVWITLWSVVISLYAATLALGISVPACLLGSVSMFLNNSLSDGLLTLGAALLIAGIVILMLLLSNLAAKGMVQLTKLTWNSIFRRKEKIV